MIAVCQRLLADIKTLCPKKRILFVMDAPRQAIYQNELASSKVIWLNQLLAQQCANFGFEFLDLTPFFYQDYQNHGAKFEFSADGHWNERTHELIATILRQYLENFPLE